MALLLAKSESLLGKTEIFFAKTGFSNGRIQKAGKLGCHFAKGKAGCI